MPLKLIPPREGKSPFYSVRGTHLGRYVDRSTKCTDRATANKVLQKWKREIERGEFAEKGEPTFADAALRYIHSGGDTRFLKRIIDHLGPGVLLREVDQERIDQMSREIYPTATPATRNRQVYTPVSAVLKYVGVEAPMKRPKGSAGQARVQWLWPEEAEKLFEEAAKIDREFAAFLILLTYTGLRLSEGLSLEVRDLRLDEGFVYLPHSKNEEPRAVFLPPFVVATLSSHPRGLDRPGRIFRFTKSGRLYKLLRIAKEKAGFPWFGFHHCCHTYATWMRRYGGLDERGLVGTGRWKDQKSVARYAHVVTTEEAQKANMLPTPKMRLK